MEHRIITLDYLLRTWLSFYLFIDFLKIMWKSFENCALRTSDKILNASYLLKDTYLCCYFKQLLFILINVDMFYFYILQNRIFSKFIQINIFEITVDHMHPTQTLQLTAVTLDIGHVGIVWNKSLMLVLVMSKMKQMYTHDIHSCNCWFWRITR